MALNPLLKKLVTQSAAKYASNPCEEVSDLHYDEELSDLHYDSMFHLGQVHRLKDELKTAKAQLKIAKAEAIVADLELRLKAARADHEEAVARVCIAHEARADASVLLHAAPANEQAA